MFRGRVASRSACGATCSICRRWWGSALVRVGRERWTDTAAIAVGSRGRGDGARLGYLRFQSTYGLKRGGRTRSRVSADIASPQGALHPSAMGMARRRITRNRRALSRLAIAAVTVMGVFLAWRPPRRPTGRKPYGATRAHRRGRDRRDRCDALPSPKIQIFGLLLSVTDARKPFSLAVPFRPDRARAVSSVRAAWKPLAARVLRARDGGDVD